MKESQEEVRKAVLSFAETLSMKESTELLLVNIGLHSTIKELVYKAFVENYDDYFEENDKVYDSIRIIKKYCREMNNVGFVTFNEKSPWITNP